MKTQTWPSEPKTRTRQQWLEWGLPDLDERYYGDWVYDDMPAMSDFCESELERVLEKLKVSQRAIQYQLNNPDLPPDQRQRLSNIRSKTLAPQQAILEVALERIHCKRGVFTHNDLCRAVEALIQVFDVNAPLSEAIQGADHLFQVFQAQRDIQGMSRVERLRTSLQIADESTREVAHQC